MSRGRGRGGRLKLRNYSFVPVDHRLLGLLAIGQLALKPVDFRLESLDLGFGLLLFGSKPVDLLTEHRLRAVGCRIGLLRLP